MHEPYEPLFSPGTGAAVGLIIGVLIVMLFLLGGCATQNVNLSPTNTGSVCDALVGPIQYNSANPKSRRHAGPDLAPDLKQRNQVGVNLRCPAYRGR